MAHMWGSRDLAFVKPAISMLRIFYLERPIIWLHVVNCAKPLVIRVCVSSNGQQMDISISHPRNLQTHLEQKVTERSRICMYETYKYLQCMYLQMHYTEKILKFFTSNIRLWHECVCTCKCTTQKKFLNFLRLTYDFGMNLATQCKIA